MRRAIGIGNKGLLLLCLVSALGGCGLPRPGPSSAEMRNDAAAQIGDAVLVPVTDRVARATAIPLTGAFPPGFLNAAVLGADEIHPGDTLELTIFENVDNGLLARDDANAALVDGIEVADDGFIFLPYVGRVRAAGNTPERLRQIVTERLGRQSPDPQVIVRRAAGDGATVSVVGGVGAQGVYPIGRSNRTLSAMLAAAGGLSVPLESARITLIRGDQRGMAWLEELYGQPGADIALRGGDRILVEEDTRSFITLGATGTQRQVAFDKPTLSVLDAIAQAGGLSSNTADPEAVFVLRRESAEVANAVLARSDLKMPQRVIYALDLTTPAGLFLAGDFHLRDDDIVYVGEAPYVAFRKALGAVSGTLGPLNNVQNLAN